MVVNLFFFFALGQHFSVEFLCPQENFVAFFEFKEEVWIVGIHLGVISTHVIFKTMILELHE